MLLRLTLHSVPLFRRYAPYASRLPAKSKHFVLAFCFQKKGSTSIHAKHLQTNAARLTLTSFRYILYIFGFSLNELCAIIFCKIFRGGKFDRLYGYFIV